MAAAPVATEILNDPAALDVPRQTPQARLGGITRIMLPRTAKHCIMQFEAGAAGSGACWCFQPLAERA
eukprot:15232734-Alexandrium_andersonii.AAC.1